MATPVLFLPATACTAKLAAPIHDFNSIKQAATCSVGSSVATLKPTVLQTRTAAAHSRETKGPGSLQLRSDGQPQVVPFEGDLQGLIWACEQAENGTVFDLQGKTVSKQVDVDIEQRPSHKDGQLVADQLRKGLHKSWSQTSFNSSSSSGLNSVVTCDSADETLPSNTYLPSSLTRNCALVDAGFPSMPTSDPGSLDAFVQSDQVNELSASGGVQHGDPNSGAQPPPATLFAADVYIGMRSRRTMCTGSSSSADSLRSSCSISCVSASDLFSRSGNDDDEVTLLPLFGLGVTLRNGRIQVPAGHSIVSTGVLALQDVVIEAAAPSHKARRSAPLLYAGHGTLALASVRIDGNASGHGLGVGAGARVTATDCTFSEHMTTGAAVNGNGATLVAARCTFEGNGQDGVAVASGAAASLTECTFSESSMLGVGAAGAGTRVRVVRCSAVGCGSHGFAASAGAMFDAVACTSKCNDIGALAFGAGTLLTAKGGSLSSNKEGVAACEGATARVSDVAIASNSTGASAAHADSSLILEGCPIMNSDGSGVMVTSGAAATLSRGYVSGSGAHGLVVQHCQSRLLAEDIVVQCNAQAGAHVSILARAVLRRCVLERNLVSGVQVTDKGTEVELEASQLARNDTIGVFVNKGATVRLRGCELVQNGSSGCEVRDRCSEAVATGCTITDNGCVGVYVHSAASATLHGGRVAANGSLGLLCGGRERGNIGSGCISLEADVELLGGSKVRHGGRIFDAAAAA